MKTKSKNISPFHIDGVPPISQAVPLSFQHVFSVIASTVTMAIIVGTAAGVSSDDLILLVQSSLIFAGLTTLLQLYPIGIFGSRLPIVYGAGFTFLPAYLSLAHLGLPVILGAQIIGGIVTLLSGGIIRKVRRFFPPVVTGTVVFTIGLSLYPIAIQYMAGGNGAENFGAPINWIIALISLVTVTVCSYFGKGIVKVSGVFIGIVVGYLASLAAGMVDFSGIGQAGWIVVPRRFPIEFSAVALIPAIIIFLVNSLQSMGDLSALTMGGLDRDIEDKELSGGLIGHGVSSIVSAIFGGFATSSYSANVGMICFNKVVSRFVIAVSAMITLFSGIIPKVGAIFLTIPYPVLGGATVTIFAMITMTGVRLILQDGLTERNTFIVALSVALGMGIVAVPEALLQFPPWVSDMLGGNPYVISAIVSFLLNIVIPNKTEQEEAEDRKDTMKRMSQQTS